MQKNGLVDLNVLASAMMTPDTSLVSIMAIHHQRDRCGAAPQGDRAGVPGEEGVLHGPQLKVDLASVSSHKVYGPNGLGACAFVDRVCLEPILSGCGQERGVRSGMLPRFLCSCFGEACREAWIRHLSTLLYEGVTKNIPHVVH